MSAYAGQMLAHASILAYASLCQHMSANAGICSMSWHMVAYASICWHMTARDSNRLWLKPRIRMPGEIPGKSSCDHNWLWLWGARNGPFSDGPFSVIFFCLLTRFPLAPAGRSTNRSALPSKLAGDSSQPCSDCCLLSD